MSLADEGPSGFGVATAMNGSARIRSKFCDPRRQAGTLRHLLGPVAEGDRNSGDTAQFHS